MFPVKDLKKAMSAFEKLNQGYYTYPINLSFSENGITLGSQVPNLCRVEVDIPGDVDISLINKGPLTVNARHMDFLKSVKGKSFDVKSSDSSSINFSVDGMTWNVQTSYSEEVIEKVTPIGDTVPVDISTAIQSVEKLSKDSSVRGLNGISLESGCCAARGRGVVVATNGHALSWWGSVDTTPKEIGFLSYDTVPGLMELIKASTSPVTVSLHQNDVYVSSQLFRFVHIQQYDVFPNWRSVIKGHPLSSDTCTLTVQNLHTAMKSLLAMSKTAWVDMVYKDGSIHLCNDVHEFKMSIPAQGYMPWLRANPSYIADIINHLNKIKGSTVSLTLIYTHGRTTHNEGNPILITSSALSDWSACLMPHRVDVDESDLNLEPDVKDIPVGWRVMKIQDDVWKCVKDVSKSQYRSYIRWEVEDRRVYSSRDGAEVRCRELTGLLG